MKLIGGYTEKRWVGKANDDERGEKRLPNKEARENEGTRESVFHSKKEGDVNKKKLKN
jgi:hypothetical protein